MRLFKNAFALARSSRRDLRTSSPRWQHRTRRASSLGPIEVLEERQMLSSSYTAIDFPGNMVLCAG